jgi:hydroxyethylthiazole kinase-like uncharacterized protein yjeF
VVGRPVAADLVVDGLVGIGGRGALRPTPRPRRAGRGDDVVAVDLPSGVDADTGEVAGAVVRADLTLVFGTCKPGCSSAPAGPPPGGWSSSTSASGRSCRPRRSSSCRTAMRRRCSRGGTPAPTSTRGAWSGVVAGSQTYPGAAVLCVGSAAGAGAGMVRFAGAAHPAEQVRLRWPEVVVSEHDGAAVVEAGRVQAWVLGPGLGTDARAAATVEAVLGTDVPVLVDADALTVCAQHPDWLRRRTAPTLLTPHDREFARFGVPVTADRLGSARRLAGELGVTVLLKGDATVVVGPDGPARVNGTGTPALATAGSGDVLSGGCGALLAQGLSPLDAGSVGAHLHGRAGALAARGVHVPASEVLAHWPAAVREALSGPDAILGG